MVGKWTSEVFTFENQYTGDMPEENNNPENLPSEDAQYATIEEALDAYGITEKIVPVFRKVTKSLLLMSVHPNTVITSTFHFIPRK